MSVGLVIIYLLPYFWSHNKKFNNLSLLYTVHEFRYLFYVTFTSTHF